jgi:ornithine carbamoyltransferase
VLTKSAKGKGRRLQDAVVETLQEALGIPDEQIRARIMGEQGADIVVTDGFFPFAIEAKNTETLAIWNAMKQAEANAEKEGKDAALVFHRNRSKTYVALEFAVFVALLATIYDQHRIRVDNSVQPASEKE